MGSVVGPLAVPGMGSDESWPGPIQGLPTGPKGEEAGCRTRDRNVGAKFISGAGPEGGLETI